MILILELEPSWIAIDLIEAVGGQPGHSAVKGHGLAASLFGQTDGFVHELPDGYDTIVGERGMGLSGGQKQRLALARALAMKPSIIICDEATSALDNRTQAIVTKSLDRLKATRIVVAHRLSTIRNADRIIVLDEGRVAESGTFEELVERGGLFAAMVKRQMT